MSLLLTAFKGVHNSSYQLIQGYSDDKLFLTNSYNGLDRDINSCDFTQYSAVIMFGLDRNLKDKLRIEPCAKLCENIRNTVYDTKAFADIFEEFSLKTAVAEKATAYLCNYAYYKVLDIMSGRALFVHIPPERCFTSDMKRNIQNAIRVIETLI